MSSAPCPASSEPTLSCWSPGPAELPGGFDNVFYMLYGAAAAAGAAVWQVQQLDGQRCTSSCLNPDP